MDDHELLREYARNRSQDAFRQLVDRHLAMVYSTACRMVRDAHLAEEVAQSVFTTLAQKAETLTRAQVVGGWLYNTTRHLAMHTVRAEQRRREREQTAAAMHALADSPDTHRILEQLEPVMDGLEAGERDVLVLRYLENRSLREVGAELGISEDAARMRVNRALEQLRIAFDRQGVSITSVLLASALAAGSTSAVPPGLSAAVTAAALAGTVFATNPAVIATLNIKLAAALIGAAILGGAGTYALQQRQIVRLRADKELLIAEQEKLQTDHAAALAAAEANQQEMERLRNDAAELFRLRNETAQIRRQLDETKSPAQSDANTPEIKIDNIPLLDVVRNLATLAELNYILDPRLPGVSDDFSGGTASQPLVTARWQNTTARRALSDLLARHNLVMVESPATGIARIASRDVGIKPVDPSAVGADTGVVNPESLITMQSTPLRDLIKIFAAGAGLNVVLDPAIANSTSVSVRWRNVSAKQALAALLDNYDLVMTEIPGTSTNQVFKKAGSSVK